MTASPASIAAGGSSVLTVTATNATAVTIAGSDGSSYTLQPAGGTQSVSPSSTTTYTASAVSSGGNASAKTMVTVTATSNPAPTVTISANPTSILAGGSSVLTVTATNATSVTVTGSDGSSYTLAPNGGMQTVSPAATTSYTATATGTGTPATATATATVSVTAPPTGAPTVTISANPTAIASMSGNSSVLTVTATNAISVMISGSDGSSYTLQPTGGTQTVTPTTTTTYTATATGVSSSATATAVVYVGQLKITADPASIVAGNPSLLRVTATSTTAVTISGSDGSSYTLTTTGGEQSVSPTTDTTYTATATGPGGSFTASVTVDVVQPATVKSDIQHVIFMLQENHTFDNYFGMLNPYRTSNSMNMGDNGVNYAVDGIDDKVQTITNTSDPDTNGQTKTYSPFKLASTCIEDLTSSWLESYGQVSRYDFSPSRAINMDGFIHTAQNYSTNCAAAGGTGCAGQFPDTTGQWAMGYYDQQYLNYYYYMASEFALSDRWFSPLSSKSIPNRIATFTGGTTQGLVFDPAEDPPNRTSGEPSIGQLGAYPDDTTTPTIFQELTNGGVTWKIYYTVTQGACTEEDDCTGGPSSLYPATDFTYLADSYQYIHANPSGSAADCTSPLQPSSAVGDSSNSFCIDTSHIAPLTPNYYNDLTNNTLPQFAFIEAGYGVNDEHPGSGQSVLSGQQEVATIVGNLMQSPYWSSSAFFLAYDEGGGPYDHVPPVGGSSNKNTDATVGDELVSDIPDISTISVNPDTNYFKPCVPPAGTTANDAVAYHCDLNSGDPGATPTDAAATEGFKAQLGFRVPNMVISPYTRRHYVSHIPMDHTAVIEFVENLFLGTNFESNVNLTARDVAQPKLLNFFDFTNVPFQTPPTNIPVPVSDPNGNTCTPSSYTANAVPSVSITASPTTVSANASSVLTVTATNATTVTISGSDGSSYTLSPSGGSQTVTPAATTTYTATATATGASASAPVTVTVQ